MPLQSSGKISVSQVMSEFGNSFKRWGSWFSIASNVPTSGKIGLSNLYARAASTPSTSSVGNQNVDTSSSSQSLTLSSPSYVTDTYGSPLSYSIQSFDSSYLSSASVNASSGLVSYTVSYNKYANTTNIIVTVTNRFGKTASLTIPLYVIGQSPTASSLGSVSLTNNTAQYTLSSYFSDPYSGTSLTYSILANPYSNASISSGILSVVGNYRNTSYTVTVQASNAYNKTASSSLSVTEQAPVTSSYYNLLSFPSNFTWYGGASTRYTITDAGSGITSFAITGDASTGSRQLESNFYISGDKVITVSIYWNERCSDHGVAIFPSNNGWSWGAYSGRISLQSDCGNMSLYGESSYTIMGTVMSTGTWYTFKLDHRPSQSKTYASLYSGRNNTSSQIGSTISINESYSGSYKIGISADQDNNTNWSQFTDLSIS